MTLLEVRKLVPSQFRIANNTITVNFKEKGEVFGLFNSITNTITLYLNLLDGTEYVAVSKEQLLHTFYHELFHCFNYFYNCDMDESLAQTFAGFMCIFQETKKFT